MELWVRSQDKRKLIPNPKLCCKFDCGRFELVDLETGAIMGSYHEEEDALKVLDDIVDFMSINNSSINGTYQQCDLDLKSKMLCTMNKIYVIPERES